MSRDTVRLDVRPTLAAGGEPFGEIMRAAAAVSPGGVLELIAPFEPVPLYAVLGRQGFRHEHSEPEPGVHLVRFVREPAPEPADG